MNNEILEVMKRREGDSSKKSFVELEATQVSTPKDVWNALQGLQKRWYHISQNPL
jgi:hypothetical protein